ncbi:MAG: cysteine-rich VLP protein, partial [Clostridia bacterium]|nr:cysteine-rich VLP protein [Clostridia bacterium]
MLKTTPSEAEAIRHIIETHCANCDEDGNCILLDDGETHRCVQRICMHGIHCNYFK